ncbi:MAG TPA: hypothetical protein VFH41_09990 [Bradyrhizobium sp.]|nr:hypothetical protein [Bradyrhizobium sp.]
MNWAWAAPLDQLWRTPSFPMWLTLVAAGFFGVIVLVTLLRAEKSVANGALTVIALLAVGIAVASTIRGFDSGAQNEKAGAQSSQPIGVALPALSCIDDLAGETVLTACEKALFVSAESAAAAVSYAASRIARLTALGDVATANANASPEIQALRRAIERDRYGLMAQALVARDRCTPSECAAFRALTDSRQIVANMNNRVYDGLIARYAPSWNTPAPIPLTTPLAALPPSVPTGRPTNAEFPTANSIPPVSIMNAEPGTSPVPRPPATSAAASTPLPAPRPPSAASPAAKKPPAPKPANAPAPPVQPASAATPTPAAANE